MNIFTVRIFYFYYEYFSPYIARFKLYTSIAESLEEG